MKKYTYQLKSTMLPLKQVMEITQDIEDYFTPRLVRSSKMNKPYYCRTCFTPIREKAGEKLKLSNSITYFS